ncbi:MAG: hypothetical protein MJY49_05085 [Bacteroidales bacterium]|nr:hypothetical protein [Bacteroidales bacterium]
MRKIVFALVAALIATAQVFAEERGTNEDFYRQSVYVGYGLFPIYNLIDNTMRNVSTTGVVHAGYEYRPLKMLGIGFDFGWLGINGKKYGQSDYTPGGISLPYCTQTRTNVFYLGPTIRGLWINKKYFTFYSLLKTGIILYERDKKCKVLPHFHFVPVGLEAGSPRITAFAEFGFGTDGMIAFGARYRF